MGREAAKTYFLKGSAIKGGGAPLSIVFRFKLYLRNRVCYFTIRVYVLYVHTYIFTLGLQFM